MIYKQTLAPVRVREKKRGKSYYNSPKMMVGEEASVNISRFASSGSTEHRTAHHFLQTLQMGTTNWRQWCVLLVIFGRNLVFTEQKKRTPTVSSVNSVFKEKDLFACKINIWNCGFQHGTIQSSLLDNRVKTTLNNTLMWYPTISVWLSAIELRQEFDLYKKCKLLERASPGFQRESRRCLGLLLKFKFRKYFW